ncbi:MAG: PEGA domain-containing protein [Nitrosomonadaceae bacterium]|nr:PEGA domain-containing protein [Nitrosomonadaceae bacterium]
MDQSNRTFIGSVVFVDIVGYSKKSVSEQILMKDRFTALLSESLKDVPGDQRIVLDTGDGAALSFIGDPEDALFVGMNLRDMLRRASPDTPEPDDESTSSSTDLFLRIGINLGPIKLVRDINGQPNIVGDGINVAQRIMSFARPGQVVVSRSFYDVVSVISDEYAQLFKYEGSRTDKHVREHEIYIVGDSAAAFDMARSGMADRAAATNPRNKKPDGVATVESKPPRVKPPRSDKPADQDASGTPSLQALLQDRKKLSIAGGALAVVVLVLAVLVATKKSDPPKATDVASASPANAAATPSVASPPKGEPGKDDAKVDAKDAAPTPGGDGAKPASPNLSTAALPASATNPTTAQKSDAAKPEDRKIAKPDAPKADAGKTEAIKDAPKPAPVVQGTVNFAVQPWGEVFVNGRSIGVSPPLKQHRLAPGKYKIEVRNSTFTPLVTTVDVKAKEDVNIRHQFK